MHISTGSSTTQAHSTLDAHSPELAQNEAQENSSSEASGRPERSLQDLISGNNASQNLQWANRLLGRETAWADQIQNTCRAGISCLLGRTDRHAWDSGINALKISARNLWAEASQFGSENYRSQQAQRSQESQSRLQVAEAIYRHLQHDPAHSWQAQHLRQQIDYAKGINNLENTFRGFTPVLFARNLFEMATPLISVGSSIASSLGTWGIIALGAKHGLMTALVGSIANSLFQSLTQIANSEINGEGQSAREITSSLGDGVIVAMACGALAYGMGLKRSPGLVWGALTFAGDIGVDFVLSGYSPTRRILGLDAEGYGHIGIGLAVTALQEVCGDFYGHGAHRVTQHIEQNIQNASLQQLLIEQDLLNPRSVSIAENSNTAASTADSEAVDAIELNQLELQSPLDPSLLGLAHQLSQMSAENDTGDPQAQAITLPQEHEIKLVSGDSLGGVILNTQPSNLVSFQVLASSDPFSPSNPTPLNGRTTFEINLGTRNTASFFNPRSITNYADYTSLLTDQAQIVIENLRQNNLDTRQALQEIRDDLEQDWQEWRNENREPFASELREIADDSTVLQHMTLLREHYAFYALCHFGSTLPGILPFEEWIFRVSEEAAQFDNRAPHLADVQYQQARRLFMAFLSTQGFRRGCGLRDEALRAERNEDFVRNTLNTISNDYYSNLRSKLFSFLQRAINNPHAQHRVNRRVLQLLHAYVDRLAEQNLLSANLESLPFVATAYQAALRRNMGYDFESAVQEAFLNIFSELSEEERKENIRVRGEVFQRLNFKGLQIPSRIQATRDWSVDVRTLLQDLSGTTDLNSLRRFLNSLGLGVWADTVLNGWGSEYSPLDTRMLSHLLTALAAFAQAEAAENPSRNPLRRAALDPLFALGFLAPQIRPHFQVNSNDEIVVKIPHLLAGVHPSEFSLSLLIETYLHHQRGAQIDLALQANLDDSTLREYRLRQVLDTSDETLSKLAKAIVPLASVIGKEAHVEALQEMLGFLYYLKFKEYFEAHFSHVYRQDSGEAYLFAPPLHASEYKVVFEASCHQELRTLQKTKRTDPQREAAASILDGTWNFLIESMEGRLLEFAALQESVIAVRRHNSVIALYRLANISINASQLQNDSINLSFTQAQTLFHFIRNRHSGYTSECMNANLRFEGNIADMRNFYKNMALFAEDLLLYRLPSKEFSLGNNRYCIRVTPPTNALRSGVSQLTQEANSNTWQGEVVAFDLLRNAIPLTNTWTASERDSLGLSLNGYLSSTLLNTLIELRIFRSHLMQVGLVLENENLDFSGYLQGTYNNEQIRLISILFEQLEKLAPQWNQVFERNYDDVLAKIGRPQKRATSLNTQSGSARIDLAQEASSGTFQSSESVAQDLFVRFVLAATQKSRPNVLLVVNLTNDDRKRLLQEARAAFPNLDEALFLNELNIQVENFNNKRPFFKILPPPLAQNINNNFEQRMLEVLHSYLTLSNIQLPLPLSRLFIQRLSAQQNNFLSERQTNFLNIEAIEQIYNDCLRDLQNMGLSYPALNSSQSQEEFFHFALGLSYVLSSTQSMNLLITPFSASIQNRGKKIDINAALNEILFDQVYGLLFQNPKPSAAEVVNAWVSRNPNFASIQFLQEGVSRSLAGQYERLWEYMDTRADSVYEAVITNLNLWDVNNPGNFIDTVYEIAGTRDEAIIPVGQIQPSQLEAELRRVELVYLLRGREINSEFRRILEEIRNAATRRPSEPPPAAAEAVRPAPPSNPPPPSRPAPINSKANSTPEEEVRHDAPPTPPPPPPPPPAASPVGRVQEHTEDETQVLRRRKLIEAMKAYQEFSGLSESARSEEVFNALFIASINHGAIRLQTPNIQKLNQTFWNSINHEECSLSTLEECFNIYKNNRSAFIGKHAPSRATPFTSLEQLKELKNTIKSYPELDLVEEQDYLKAKEEERFTAEFKILFEYAEGYPIYKLLAYLLKITAPQKDPKIRFDFIDMFIKPRTEQIQKMIKRKIPHAVIIAYIQKSLFSLYHENFSSLKDLQQNSISNHCEVFFPELTKFKPQELAESENTPEARKIKIKNEFITRVSMLLFSLDKSSVHRKELEKCFRGGNNYLNLFEYYLEYRADILEELKAVATPDLGQEFNELVEEEFSPLNLLEHVPEEIYCKLDNKNTPIRRSDYSFPGYELAYRALQLVKIFTPDDLRIDGFRKTLDEYEALYKERKMSGLPDEVNHYMASLSAAKNVKMFLSFISQEKLVAAAFKLNEFKEFSTLPKIERIQKLLDTLNNKTFLENFNEVLKNKNAELARVRNKKEVLENSAALEYLKIRPRVLAELEKLKQDKLNAEKIKDRETYLDSLNRDLEITNFSSNPTLNKLIGHALLKNPLLKISLGEMQWNNFIQACEVVKSSKEEELLPHLYRNILLSLIELYNQTPDKNKDIEIIINSFREAAVNNTSDFFDDVSLYQKSDLILFNFFVVSRLPNIKLLLTEENKKTVESLEEKIQPSVILIRYLLKNPKLRESFLEELKEEIFFASDEKHTLIALDGTQSTQKIIQITMNYLMKYPQILLELDPLEGVDISEEMIDINDLLARKLFVKNLEDESDQLITKLGTKCAHLGSQFVVVEEKTPGQYTWHFEPTGTQKTFMDDFNKAKDKISLGQVSMERKKIRGVAQLTTESFKALNTLYQLDRSLFKKLLSFYHLPYDLMMPHSRFVFQKLHIFYREFKAGIPVAIAFERHIVPILERQKDLENSHQRPSITVKNKQGFSSPAPMAASALLAGAGMIFGASSNSFSEWMQNFLPQSFVSIAHSAFSIFAMLSLPFLMTRDFFPKLLRKSSPALRFPRFSSGTHRTLRETGSSKPCRSIARDA